MWTAQRLRDLRLHLGWTQAQMADELLVRDATISGWENNKTMPRRMFYRALRELAERSGFQEKSDGSSS
jgi:transcriptional regulator with XRE-family HTH domain